MFIPKQFHLYGVWYTFIQKFFHLIIFFLFVFICNKKGCTTKKHSNRWSFTYKFFSTFFFLHPKPVSTFLSCYYVCTVLQYTIIKIYKYLVISAVNVFLFRFFFCYFLSHIFVELKWKKDIVVIFFFLNWKWIVQIWIKM